MIPTRGRTEAARGVLIARWALERLAGGPTGESIIGDIEEQFARGRSCSWYWQQVLVAIVVGIYADFRLRPFVVIFVLGVTPALTFAWVEFTSSLYAWAMHRWLHAWADSSFLLFEFWIPFGGGTCLVWCLGAALSGRLSARLTNRNRAVLIGVVLVHVILSLWWTRHFWLHAEFTTSVSPRLWIPNFLWAAVVLVGMPLSTLLGALWGQSARTAHVRNGGWMKRLSALALVICGLSVNAQLQQLAFDAASVKVNKSDQLAIMRRPTPGRVFFENAPLRLFVEEAYGIPLERIVNLPDWDARERFDLVATYDPNLRSQVPLMFQRLLEERFSLRAHREIRDVPVYHLVRVRDDVLGPGLRRSTTDCAPQAGQRSPCTMRIAPGAFEGVGSQWGALPPNIGVSDRPIIDKTGLTGSFDITLHWTSERSPSSALEAAAVAQAPATPSGDRVSIFTALQEQLGLKLEPSRGSLGVLVIDSVARPMPD